MAQQGYGYSAAQMGMGGMQAGTMDDAAVEKPKKSSKVGLFAGIGVGVLVLGAVAYFLLSGSEPPPTPEEDPQLAKLQAQLNDLKAQAVEPTPTPAQEAAAPTAATEEKPAASAAEEKPSEDVAAKAAATEEAAQEEEAAAPAKPMTRAERRKAARAARVAKRTAAAAPKAAKEPKAKAETKTAGGGLGALLDNDVASGKKAAEELPKTPSRGDVKSAMQPVQARASKCAKYSKGTVQLKIVVGSDGRVKSSTPVGGSADQTAANCVSMIARTARFPRFKDPSFSINYPMTLK